MHDTAQICFKLDYEYNEHFANSILAIIKVSGYAYRWLAGDYDLEKGHF